MDGVVPLSERAAEPALDGSPARFFVLGPVRASRAGVDVHVGGMKQRSIVAVLVASWGRPISLDRIVDIVYGEDAGAGARNSVYTYISAIRRDLGEVVRREAGGYRLTVEDESIDAHRFETTVQSALSILDAHPEAAATALREALAMWRGHAYADVDDRGWFGPEITRLSELRLSALEARIDADLALGRHRELLGELEALTIEHPLRERLRAQHMLALYRLGRQTEALRSYQEARTYLANEIGIEPSPDLRQLEQRILDQDPILDAPAIPSLTERAVLVVDIADPVVLTHLEPSARSDLAGQMAQEFERAVTRQGGVHSGQRGTALYAALPTIGAALETIGELTSPQASIRIRAAVDFGEVELHDSGVVAGPPLRRSVGMVAAAHPGQVLVSAGAQQALLDDDGEGWTVRSLGSHPISGIEGRQQVFQLVLPGREDPYPPLLLDTAPPPFPTERGAVAGYELRRPISSDLAATTYRAYQPSVGREVLVTAIDAMWANQADFVSRFEVETQLVTRLQHPHIVPVLDYWRDQNGAYLVTPPLGSNTLDQALLDDALDDSQRRLLITQIGEALSQAHQLGVVHGSVAPRTVTLDENGNGYLSGAGFVMRLTDAPPVRSEYTPPELERGEPLGVAADVFGLGCLIRSLLGETGMDQSVSAIIARATADRPGERYPSIGDLLLQLAPLLGESGATAGFTPARNPYKGLEAFGEADARDFHGRTRAVGDLIERIAERRLVAVVGPSGCGKSSLVEAGLIPAVKERDREAHEKWVTAVMFPGSYPFVELELALARVAVRDPGPIGDLFEDDHGLVRAVKRILPKGTRLLLVIDQFEELFTLTRDEPTRDRFLRALVELAGDDRSNARVVVTLRADFFDRPLQYPSFGRLLKEGTFPLTTPEREELADAIRLPAEAVGVSWVPGLVEQIVDNVGAAPGALPLLQYALTEVFAARESDELTLDDYHSVGGVLGAVGAHADQVYESLKSSQREVARHMFLRLVAVQPSGEQTRQRTRLVDLAPVAPAGELDAVLSAFGDARLVTFDRDPITRGPTVEVAHEAILTRWSRLASWITAAREDLLLHQRLADATTEWEESGRSDAYLLAGGRLQHVLSWSADTEFSLTVAEHEYLALSERRLTEDLARKRRRRNVVLSGFALAALVATALGTLAWIGGQNAASNAELAHSRELRASAIGSLDTDPELSVLLSMQAMNGSKPDVGSLAALHKSLAADHTILTYTWPGDQELGQDLSAFLSPDGHLLVASSGGTYVEVVDVDSGQRLWGEDLGGDGIARAVFTADGLDVVVIYGWAYTDDQREADAETKAALGVHLLDAYTGEEHRHLTIGPRCGVTTRPSMLYTVDDGTSSFVATELGTDSNCNMRGVLGGDVGDDRRTPWPTIIDLTTGESERLTDERPISDSPSALLSRNGAVLAESSGDDESSTVVYEPASARRLGDLSGWLRGISADGSVVLTEHDGRRLVWDLTHPDVPRAELDGGPDVGQLRLSPDGARTAEAFDSSIVIYDTQSGAEVDRLVTGLGANGGLSFDRDGTRLVVNEVRGNTAVVLDLEAPTELGSFELCDDVGDGVDGPFSPIASPQGQIAVLFSCDSREFPGTELIIDPSGMSSRQLSTSAGSFVTFSEDGLTSAEQTGEPDYHVGPVVLRDTRSAQVTRTMEGLCEHLFGSGNDCREYPNSPFPDHALDLSLSPDSQFLAMAGELSDGLTIWSTDTGRIVATPTIGEMPGFHHGINVEFSPDGSLVASFEGSPSQLWMLDPTTWEPTVRYDPPEASDTDSAPTANLLFTPDGKTLIGTDALFEGVGRIVFMDGTSLQHSYEIPDAHDGAITQLALSPDGTLLASSGMDGFVRVWDVMTHALVDEILVSSDDRGVGGVAFIGPSHIAAADTSSGELQLFTIDGDELVDLARSRITRAFTATECATYRIDPCPTLDELRSD